MHWLIGDSRAFTPMTHTHILNHIPSPHFTVFWTTNYMKYTHRVPPDAPWGEVPVVRASGVRLLCRPASRLRPLSRDEEETSSLQAAAIICKRAHRRWTARVNASRGHAATARPS